MHLFIDLPIKHLQNTIRIVASCQYNVLSYDNILWVPLVEMRVRELSDERTSVLLSANITSRLVIEDMARVQNFSGK